MKIIMVCEFFDPNLEFQENLLAKYYSKHGHQVIVLTSTLESVFDYYDDKHEMKSEGKIIFTEYCKIIRLKYKWIRLKKRLRRFEDIFKILMVEEPDLIYFHDIIPNLLEGVNYVRKRQQCKMILDYHGDFSNSGKNWFSLKILHGIIRNYLYLKPSRKFLSKIFPIVPNGISFLNKIYRVPLDEMELLPLGADLDLAKNIMNLNIGKSIREKNGIPKDAFVIFTGGKLNPRKKIEVLIESLEILNNFNIYLFIAGEASPNDLEYKNKLMNLAKKNQNIFFLGWLNTVEIYSYLNASNIAIYPASQSVLWQKSISMNLPLIVGDTGNQSTDYLNLYDNILILNSNEINPQTLSEKIFKLYSNQNEVLKMSLGAKKTTDDFLDWNKLIYKTLRFN